MSIRPLLFTVALLGAGCARPEAPLPICDGAARRPANPHGSILTPAPDIAPVGEDGANAASPSGGCA